MDDDIIRIIISTDNHLGFAYKDPIRCDDCFASFEEVFIAAKEVCSKLLSTFFPSSFDRNQLIVCC
jgi:hypothetical protein